LGTIRGVDAAWAADRATVEAAEPEARNVQYQGRDERHDDPHECHER
jgi:hypothetical protein